MPAGYTRLVYIESTGKQYIDTLCTPTKNFRAVVDLLFTAPTGDGGFGYGASGRGQSFRFWRTVTEGVATYKVNINDTYMTENIFPKTFGNDTGRHVLDLSNTAKSIDGVPFGDTSGLTKTLGGTFYLFATREGWKAATSPVCSSYRIYSCQLYEGSTLVRDFVPCADGNGKPGLYDTVEGKPYYNKASGADFVLGPPTDPESLVIISSRADISPEYGYVTGLAAGDTFQCSAPAAWTNAANDKAGICAGWKLYDENSVLVSNGVGNVFTYIHPGASRVLEWQWDVLYKVSATAGAGGTVSPAEQWVAPGGTATVTATADQGEVFVKWTGDAPASVIYANPAVFVVTVPREMVARFGYDYPEGGAFVWDNATGSLANWTNAVNWTAKEGYPGLSTATATFGSDTPTAEASLGGASVTNGTLYVERSDVTIENGYLLTKVNMSDASRLVVASDAILDTYFGTTTGWSALPHDAEVTVKGVLTNYSANLTSPVNGTNVTIRVDGGKMFGLNAPMLNTCTNFQFEVVNGGEARLGGCWVYEKSIGLTSARSGYAAKEGGVLVHNGSYGIPLQRGEGNYLVVSNAAFGTSQNNMSLCLSAKGNFADFHNARIGVDGANGNILFRLEGVGNRLGFTGTLQLVPQNCEVFATGRDGTIDFNQDGYTYIRQAIIRGSNNTFRVGRDAAVYMGGQIYMWGAATNALVEVCGFCTNAVSKDTIAVQNGSRFFVNGGTFCSMSGTGGLVVTNDGVIAVAGESPYALVRNLYLRDGGTLEFSLPETPWAAAPVETTLTGGIFDGSKVRVEVGEFREKSFTDIPLVKFIPYNSGQKFTVPENLDGFLELHKCLSSGSTLRWEDNTLILRTKYHKDGLTLIVR